MKIGLVGIVQKEVFRNLLSFFRMLCILALPVRQIIKNLLSTDKHEKVCDSVPGNIYFLNRQSARLSELKRDPDLAGRITCKGFVRQIGASRQSSSRRFTALILSRYTI